jgi:hypothetical protein
MFDESSIMPYIVVLLVALAAAGGIWMGHYTSNMIAVDTSSPSEWRYYHSTPPPGKSQAWHENNQAQIYKIWNMMRLELPWVSSRPDRAQRAANRDMVRNLANN